MSDQVRRTLRLGLLQMSMEVEPEKNVSKALRMVRSAARKGANIVCLPELFTTRYFAQYEGDDLSMEERMAFLETIPGKVTDRLCQAARENGVVIVGGSIYEKDGDRLFNSSVVIDADGTLLGKYRKTHIPHDENFYEQHYFAPGDTGFKVFDTKFAKISVLICYDQWFPEAARCCALQGAEIIFYPTAIGLVKGIEQAEGSWQNAWETVMRGHAIANNVIVAGVNRCGHEDKMEFWGGSFISDAFGRVVMRGGRRDRVLVHQVDLDHGRDIREGWRFFHNRRPACYGDIIKKVDQ